VAKMKITLVKSSNGYGPDQRDTLRTLGLRRIRQSVIREDIPSVRGQVMKVKHLVTVEEA
jgi:large subunit ribosomal protein L30